MWPTVEIVCVEMARELGHNGCQLQIPRFFCPGMRKPQFTDFSNSQSLVMGLQTAARRFCYATRDHMCK
jgi:hypothetical protein